LDYADFGDHKSEFPTRYHGIMDTAAGVRASASYFEPYIEGSPRAIFEGGKPNSPTWGRTGIPTVVVRPARFAGTQGAPQATACGGASLEVLVDKPPGAAASRPVHVILFYWRKITMSPGPPSTTLLDLLLPFEWPLSPDPAVSPALRAKSDKGQEEPFRMRS
jgi:hypothetical protein